MPPPPLLALGKNNMSSNEFTAPAFSEEALALAFADRHSCDLRFVAAWEKWLWYDGGVWRLDNSRFALDLVRKLTRAAANDCNEQSFKRKIASAMTARQVLALAASDRRLAATPDIWDHDDWTINTPSSAVDLRTGEFRDAKPDDYFTKSTSVSAGGDCPRFLAFLNQMTGDDAALVSYMQRLFGYALTGSTREQVLHFIFGSGANGKSALISTVACVMGDYHKTASPEVFQSGRSDGGTSAIAELRGARLVTASETEAGKRWNEPRIKALTGGDEVTARHLYGHPFAYLPKFKMVLAGNHKPTTSVDTAMRRRLRLIPFAVTIAEANRDHQLVDKLKAEAPGILAWMIEGCLLWQRDRLKPPVAVVAASEAYMTDQDTLAHWIESCAEPSRNSFETSADLYASWCGWCGRTGEEPGTQRRLTEALISRGLKAERRNAGTRGLIGLKLLKVNA